MVDFGQQMVSDVLVILVSAPVFAFSCEKVQEGPETSEKTSVLSKLAAQSRQSSESESETVNSDAHSHQ